MGQMASSVYLEQLQTVRKPERAAMLIRAFGCAIAGNGYHQNNPIEAGRLIGKYESDASTVEGMTSAGQLKAFLRAAGYLHPRSNPRHSSKPITSSV